MKDQAANLREQFQLLKKHGDQPKKQKTIAVVSGKGGVGKSNFSLNFSLALQKKDASVLLIDMDVGMGNIDILMGTPARNTIVDFFNKNLSFASIINIGFNGLEYIAGGSGLTDFVKMKKERVEEFFEAFYQNMKKYDYIIFDMGAGINEDSLTFILSVDDVIVITTPEPTAITDAYATMKFIHLKKESVPLYLVVNRVTSRKEGISVATRLQQVFKQFLFREIIYLGMLPDDQMVPQAVRKQIPFLFYNENAAVTKELGKITDKYYKQEDFSETDPLQEKRSFISKWRKFLFER